MKPESWYNMIKRKELKVAKKLNVRYEMIFTCDEWLIKQIKDEWEYALDEVDDPETTEEEEIFKIALAYALIDNYALSYNEREAIFTQSHEIYKWWKENKDNV